MERGRQHFDRRRQQIDLTPAECKNDSVERSRERGRVCSSAKVAPYPKLEHKVSSHSEFRCVASTMNSKVEQSAVVAVALFATLQTLAINKDAKVAFFHLCQVLSYSPLHMLL